MTLRFLIDAQLPPRLAVWLRSRGHEADHVQDFDLRASPDRWVVMQALKTGAIIITKDADFSAASVLSQGCRVVWLRIGNAANRNLLKKLESAIAEIEKALEDGQTIIEVHE